MIIRWIFSIVFILCGSTSFTQVQIQDPLSGKVLSVSKYGGISGNPFLYDQWVLGEVTLKQGKYTNLELKYDAFSNMLYFNKNGEMFEFQDEVISFLLMPNTKEESKQQLFLKGLESGDLGKNQFVQVLYNGTIGFYKLTIVFVSEMNKINEGVVKTFQKSERYYFKVNDRLEMIRFNKKDILNFFADRSTAVENYATAAGLSFKKELDIVKMLEFYQTLK
jgi:hypothetical protein